MQGTIINPLCVDRLMGHPVAMLDYRLCQLVDVKQSHAAGIGDKVVQYSGKQITVAPYYLHYLEGVCT
jgi:hypothetical protein